MDDLNARRARCVSVDVETLGEVRKLHGHGITYKDVAHGMGVACQTLYNQLASNGCSTNRKRRTDMSGCDSYYKAYGPIPG